jgi:hypothetical protein
MKKFNNGKDIKHDVKEKIEKYFDFRWRYDRNQAIDDD